MMGRVEEGQEIDIQRDIYIVMYVCICIEKDRKSWGQGSFLVR